MLLDEPSLGLAPLVVEDIYQIIQKINAEQRMAMLLVEQNARASLGIADEGYVLETAGRSEWSGEKLRENEDVQNFIWGYPGSAPGRAIAK